MSEDITKKYYLVADVADSDCDRNKFDHCGRSFLSCQQLKIAILYSLLL